VHTRLAEAYTTGDPVLLERLVQNLVENGIKHNVGQGGWVLLATRVDHAGRSVVEVSNSGPHVPRYELPSLFEPFHRLNNDRLANAHGAGLGLSIVRAVVDAHGGTVAAESRDEGGLVVTITLPPVAVGSIVDRRPRPTAT
jgi:signal transduction histidine kinase